MVEVFTTNKHSLIHSFIHSLNQVLKYIWIQIEIELLRINREKIQKKKNNTKEYLKVLPKYLINELK